MRSANAAFRQIDASLEETRAGDRGAAGSGRSGASRCRWRGPGSSPGWLLVFVPAIQELSASILLFSSGSITLAVAVYNLYETGYLGPVAALAIVTMVIIGAAIWLATRLGRAGARRRARRRGALARRPRMAGISIERVSKRYGAVAAVRDLSLEVRDREFVTLLGPSGCGKTTLLRLIAGFLAPDAGIIRVDGLTLSSTRAVVPPERRGMGMVFQNYAIWPHKTVYENVAFGLEVRRVPRAEARERVARVLELVNLAGLERRFPSELSGGQQQRVALARSLVVEPSILLLDEPLSNLDAKLRERMRWELKELQRRTGITFVYVTHDQAEAMALSDRIAVMHGGELLQDGPAARGLRAAGQPRRWRTSWAW